MKPPQEHETREADIQWNRIVEMKLVPHPNINHPQAIEMDYAMAEYQLWLRNSPALYGVGNLLLAPGYGG